MQVSLWMKEQPVCATAEQLLDEVVRAMREGGFRHAPVVDADGRLVGMLSDRDIREHRGFLPTTRVSAAMVEPAVAVVADDPIERAARLMVERKIGALPVVDAERRVIGIVTETDILKGFLDGVGTGEQAARIDFQFRSPEQGFADAVQAVEGAGGIVLGLGTFQTTAEGSGARRFFVRVMAPRLEPIVDALGQRGVSILAVHHLPAPPA
jgi:acetoin utilization protein AcuB